MMSIHGVLTIRLLTLLNKQKPPPFPDRAPIKGGLRHHLRSHTPNSQTAGESLAGGCRGSSSRSSRSSTAEPRAWPGPGCRTRPAKAPGAPWGTSSERMPGSQKGAASARRPAAARAPGRRHRACTEQESVTTKDPPTQRATFKMCSSGSKPRLPLGQSPRPRIEEPIQDA